MRRAFAVFFVLLWLAAPSGAQVFKDATPAAPAQEREPWVDAKDFESSQPPPAPPRARAKPPDYGDQAEIERRRQARLDFTQALDEFNAGNYAKAAQLFQRHLAVFPENGQARKYLAQARRLAQAQTHGTLRVLSQPRARVLLDGRPRGATPLSLNEVSLGPHLLEVEANGVRQGREVAIKPMTTTTVEFDLRPPAEQTRAQTPAPPAATPPAPPTAAPPAAPAATYASKMVLARLTPPPGWRVEEDAAQKQLRLWPPQEGVMIQVNSYELKEPVPPEAYARQWGKVFLASPENPLKQKVSGQKTQVQGRPAYQAVYRGKGAQATTVFLSRGKRVYIFSAICLAAQCPRLQGPFWTVLESFSPLN